MIRDAERLLERLRRAHAAIRDAVVAACERQAMEALAAVVPDEMEARGGAGGGGAAGRAPVDTVFALDRVSEEALRAHFESIAERWPCVLVAEGLAGDPPGRVALPRGARAEGSELTIIVDPIDGTRGLMYQKRPAWILTGVARAPAGGGSATLADIELALQTEIPLVRQHLSDALWVVGGAVGGERYNRLTGETAPLSPRPSHATTIAQGFGGVARFFPGRRDLLAAVDDAVVERLLGPPEPGRAQAFEDQYISTGGQLYELMMGHDRWVADLRPLAEAHLRRRGRAPGLCCHPYDLCTESIARAAGVVVTDEHGERLAAPLDVTTDVAWLGFANATLRAQIFPVLREVLDSTLGAAGSRAWSVGRGPLATLHAPLAWAETPSAPDDDLDHFTASLRAETDFFGGGEVVVARAPGRLDVTGGIADYSGSLVLELPLAAATFAAAQLTDDGRVTVRTLRAAELDAEPTVSVSLDALVPHGAPLAYPNARALLAHDPRRRWAAYVIGTLVVLAREHGLTLERGLRLLIDSGVPPGKGVGSSAALEVAAMQAICAAYGVHLDARDLALACQRVENLVVGAPCGVMDQMTSACGEAGTLLALECQPAQLRGHVPVPPGLELWGIDSGIRHEVGGAEYGDVRVGAFMGYRVIADLAGLPAASEPAGRASVRDDRWGGYLANVTPSEWEREYRDRVPVTVTGREFLRRYGGITDRVTSVDPDRTYAVRQPTAHPIYEHHRVRLFHALLAGGAATEPERELLGELMYQSHESYGACGLGSSGTDRLVALARAAARVGIYGAKITGGGSGGTVAVLARAGAGHVVEGIARRYAAETGREARVLGGSSPGAAQFGTRWYRLA